MRRPPEIYVPLTCSLNGKKNGTQSVVTRISTVVEGVLWNGKRAQVDNLEMQEKGVLKKSSLHYFDCTLFMLSLKVIIESQYTFN